MNKKSLGIYQSNICQMGGVETFLYNICWWLRNYYDITVIYCSGDDQRIRKMMQLVKMKKYNEKEKFEFDIVIRNSVWGTVCDKIISKENRYIEMRHANYKYLLDHNWLFSQYHKWDKTNEIVGCGEFVSKMSHEVLGDNPTTIKNILLPRQKTQKVIRLISCMRIDGQKGWGRMQKMMDMMREANIKFTWDIFTNNPQKCNYEEVHFWKQRYDIWDYLSSADYTVLLSDSEGLPYTIQESLQYQVPCIVTDVSGCTELIKDGVNGYVVPLDMNFDISKIKKIPKCPEYDNHALEDWLKYLEYDGVIINEKEIIERYEKEKNMKVKVKANKGFENVKDAERSTKDKAVYFIEGDIWETNKERAEYLQSKGAVTIIEEVKKEKVKEQWAVTEEEDGNVHIRPIVNKKIIDTPIEEIIKPKETKKKKSKKK